LLVILFVRATTIINRAKIRCYIDSNANGEGKGKSKDAGSLSSLKSFTKSKTNSISGRISGISVKEGVLSFLDILYIP
jgi:hypothetical protein